MKQRNFAWLTFVAVLIGLLSLAGLAGSEPVANDPRVLVERKADHYELAVRSTTAKVGQPHQAELTLTGRNGYKVNAQYPTRLELEATSEGTQLQSTKLGKGDALELSEKVARFPLKFTAANPGEASIQIEIRFSVCNDKQCDLASEKLAVAIPVTP